MNTAILFMLDRRNGRQIFPVKEVPVRTLGISHWRHLAPNLRDRWCGERDHPLSDDGAGTAQAGGTPHRRRGRRTSRLARMRSRLRVYGGLWRHDEWGRRLLADELRSADERFASLSERGDDRRRPSYPMSVTVALSPRCNVATNKVDWRALGLPRNTVRVRVACSRRRVGSSLHRLRPGGVRFRALRSTIRRLVLRL